MKTKSQHIHQSILSRRAESRLSKHCIATIVTKDIKKLTNSEKFSKYLVKALKDENVHYLGDVSHQFDNKSFSTIFALSESHISVHTWPERFTVQLDVFLCNYMHDNTEKCQRIFEKIIEYFDPKETERIYIDRL